MRLSNKPERGWVGDHDRGRPRPEGRSERVEVHAAVRRRRDRDRPVAGHGRRRGIRPVRAVRHEHLVALEIAALAVIGPDHQDAGELALGPCGRLERDRAHPGDLGQRLLELPQQLERALGDLVGRHRVELGEARQAGRPLVELRVELHRARPERVEPGVDREVELGQVHVVADDVRLVHLRQRGRRGAAGVGRQPIEGVRGWVGDLAATASGTAALEERGLEPRTRDAHRVPPAVGTLPSSAPAGAGAGAWPPGHRRSATRAGLDPDRRPAGDDLAERGHEARDVAGGRELGGAQEQAVGQARIVGFDVGEDQAGKEAALDQPAVHDAGIGDAHRELVQVRARVEPLDRRWPPARPRAPPPWRRRPPRRRAARAGRSSRGRSRRPGPAGPGSCRCCWPPCRGGCPARAREASSRRPAGHRGPWSCRRAARGSGGRAHPWRRGSRDTDRRTAARCRAAGPRPRRCPRRRPRVARGPRARPAR